MAGYDAVLNVQQLADGRPCYCSPEIASMAIDRYAEVLHCQKLNKELHDAVHEASEIQTDQQQIRD